MLQLLIDKEKKEISELNKGLNSKRRTKSNSSGQAKSEQNASVHNKLFDDSKQRDIKMKENKKKHMLDELLSMSNDKRETFFVPKINESSKKIATKTRKSKSNSKNSINENLYNDAVERKKSSEANERTKIQELKKKINQSMMKNMLMKSKKILYSNFKQKFDDIVNKLDIDNSEQAKIEYDQYLVIIKSIIFLDQYEESKISESKEVFEGWRTMMGDMYGYVTKSSLHLFLCEILNLKPTQTKIITKNETSIRNDSKLSSKNKEIDLSKIQVSKIDLLQAEEMEVRLESVGDDSNSLQNIQKLYQEIKGETNSNLPVKKNIKNFFNLKLKENQQKSSKLTKGKDEQNTSLNKSGITSQTLGNMIYKNLKQEIVLNKTRSDDPSFSIESNQKLDVTDLLLYRGEKYKENRTKLIEQSDQKKVKECTFKPKLITNKKISNPKKTTGLVQTPSLSDVKYKINGDLEKYIHPLAVKKNSPPKTIEKTQESESNSAKTANVNFNDQQSASVNQTEIERHQEEEKLISEICFNVETPEAKNNDDSQTSKIPNIIQNQIVHKIEGKKIQREDQQNSREKPDEDKIKIIEEERVTRVVESPQEDDMKSEESESEEPSFPVLFLDVNLGGGKVRRLIIKDGDDAMQIATDFCKENNLSIKKERKLKSVIQKQLASVLTKIKEEESDY